MCVCVLCMCGVYMHVCVCVHVVLVELLSAVKTKVFIVVVAVSRRFVCFSCAETWESFLEDYKFLLLVGFTDCQLVFDEAVQ